MPQCGLDSTHCVSCLSATQNVAFGHVSRPRFAQFPRKSTDTAVIPFDNRTRRDSTCGPFVIIVIMRNSDYEAQFTLLLNNINELHVRCYVGMLAMHVLPSRVR
jgi:hypothetical protein